MTITCAGCTHTYAETALFCPNCGRPKVREVIGDALLGKVLGERFEVKELIGQGGSGTIYRAEHVTLRRKVAIKVLHNELSRDDLAVERFRREATTVAEIDNEHIVEIHDFGRTPDGRLYLAMELLEGETLDAVLQREKQLSVERAADILIQVGEALMEAHAIGYVHRDLRPRNLYLANRRGRANFVKLLDFGLAKLVENDASAASTSLGMTFGDPRYMSPEQARGDRIDRRADIYQLGCVAYEMLTGAPPFAGNRVFDILTKQVTETPVPLPTRRPGVPLWMEAAVAKMLAKDPENRFATTTRMVEALRRGLDTGEVMDDEIARRRESIPPPSGSRVMQKMGIAQASDVPVHRPEAKPEPKPEAKPEATPEPKPDQTTRGIVPVPAVTEPKPAQQADSVELLRKRTGTPRVGVPVVPAAPVDEQPPVAGVIESKPRAKQPTRPPAEPGISQVWYDEGERGDVGEDAPRRAPRAKKLDTPSATDLSLYDDLPRRSRWPYAVAALGLLAIGGVAFALTRGGDSPPAEPAASRPAVATVTVDAAPSQIISPETPTPDAAPAPVVADPPKPDPKAKPAVVRDSKPAPRDTVVRKPVTGGRDPNPFVLGGDEPSFRRPGGGTNTTGTTGTTTTGTSGTTVVTGTSKTGGTSTTGTKPDPNGSGLTDGPKDPYEETPPGPSDGGDPSATPEKKAEFFANLGSQQLAAGDTANAASNFKKALELDARNVSATIGLGEIALRQGLFGDAIFHLRKASRMAPRSSRVFTLLGEAFLNSGNTREAITNFKKALQLDPDNARAKEGFDDATARQSSGDGE